MVISESNILYTVFIYTRYTVHNYTMLLWTNNNQLVKVIRNNNPDTCTTLKDRNWRISCSLNIVAVLGASIDINYCYACIQYLWCKHQLGTLVQTIALVLGSIACMQSSSLDVIQLCTQWGIYVYSRPITVKLHMNNTFFFNINQNFYMFSLLLLKH